MELRGEEGEIWKRGEDEERESNKSGELEQGGRKWNS